MQEAQQRAQLLESVLRPEPVSFAAIIELVDETPRSTDGAGASLADRTAIAEPCGTGLAVPRMLRATAQVRKAHRFDQNGLRLASLRS